MKRNEEFYARWEEKEVESFDVVYTYSDGSVETCDEGYETEESARKAIVTNIAKGDEANLDRYTIIRKVETQEVKVYDFPENDD